MFLTKLLIALNVLIKTSGKSLWPAIQIASTLFRKLNALDVDFIHPWNNGLEPTLSLLVLR